MKMGSLAVLMGIGMAPALAAPSQASGQVAQNWGFPGDPICGGTNFTLCASVSLTFSELTGEVELVVTNWTDFDLFGDRGVIEGSGSTVFRQIAFYNAGLTGLGWNGSLDVQPTGFDWHVTLNPIQAGGEQLQFGVGADPPPTGPNGNGVPVGQTLTFRFSLTGNGLPIFAEALAAGQVGMVIQAQSGPGGDSSQLISVPEPTSLLLMGTGLLGVAAIRRRRNMDS